MKFRDLAAELLAITSHGEGALKVLTKWGYADLLAKIMPERSDLKVQLNIAAEKAENLSSHTMRPLLHLACERSLPNLETIKVLVERAQVDVDAIDVPTYNYSDGTALHILAQPSNWWQAQALAYLVDHGANLNAQDSNGCTPLRIAIDSRGHKSAEISLRGGADPNMIGEDGLSCLNKAGS